MEANNGNEAKMRIAFMNGGLGNQVFQYIFVRYLEESTKTRVLVDDSYFHMNKMHNGYEMEYVFPDMTKPLFLSEFFGADVWRHVINIGKKKQ